MINVPPRNDFFTGREKILSKLHDTLKVEGRAAIKQVISGLGGIGKTATATEYAHRHANDYSHVLWTGAADAAALNEGFARLARELGLPQYQKSEETVAEVKRWLAQNPGWLLILDNADEPGLLTPFLPSAAVGAILLTSRGDVFDGLGVVHPLALDVLTADEAAEFLFARIGKDGATASADERAAARELAETLGGLALALEQAGAYVFARPRYTLRRYAEEYRAETLRLLGKAKPKTGDYQETVLTTWSVSFRAAAGESGAAAEILRVSAFLAPDLIPCAVLEAGKAEIGAALGQEGTIDDALAALTRYSLIRMDAANDGYAVHRLVQAVIQDEMNEETRRDWAERAVAAVNRAFPDVSDFHQWELCAGFLPHGTQLAGVIEEFGLETAEAGGLLNRCGYFLKERARYAEALPMYERSLAIWEKALGAEHPDTALSLNNLAGLYRAQGEYGKAEPLYERSLAILEKTLGGEHPTTRTVANNLAGLRGKLSPPA
jgi:tetratricopeptide (TPR) repeat protein